MRSAQLARAFNQMAADVERHQHTAVEQERIRRELELGRQIQNEMLPHAPLNLGLTQVQGVSVPAREVGGDFFNYFVLDDGQIALLMGDVSGKGVGAALLMANIQASLRIRLGLGQSLAAVADALDRDIEANSPGPVYATLFIGVLDPATRVLRYVNAGHNPQYVLRQRRRPRADARHGLAGRVCSPGAATPNSSCSWRPATCSFFYTDGCVEAENDQGEPFGMERLEPLLLASVQVGRSRCTASNPRSPHSAARTEPLDDATLMTVQGGVMTVGGPGAGRRGDRRRGRCPANRCASPSPATDPAGARHRVVERVARPRLCGAAISSVSSPISPTDSRPQPTRRGGEKRLRGFAAELSYTISA